MSKVPWIFTISTPRSGTTQVARLFSTMAAVREYSEPFHYANPTYLDPPTLALFAKAAGLQLTTSKNAELAAWVAADRARTLDLLQMAAGPRARATTIKLFHDHLDLADFQRSFVDHPRGHFLFLERRPVDAYISLIKARSHDQWLLVDTTGKKPPLVAAEFAAWHRDQSHWFASTRAMVAAAGRPSVSLTYEDDVLPGESWTQARLLGAASEMGLDLRPSGRLRTKALAKRTINRALAAFGRPPPFEERLGLIKQDAEPDRAARVANWPQFTADLATMPGGLAMLDRFFTDPEPAPPPAP